MVDERLFRSFLVSAKRDLEKFVLEEKPGCYRLLGLNVVQACFHCEGWIDVFGTFALLHLRSDRPLSEEDREKVFRVLEEVYPSTECVLHERLGGSFRVATKQGGSKGNPVRVVKEYDCLFELQPYRENIQGLFVDQRASRKAFCALKGVERVLNLFCFTGAFSVAVARAFGAETTNVDVSTVALGWAKRNFGLNGLDETKHLFFRRDALEVLRNAQRKGVQWDLIVCDPPSFSRTKQGGVFSIEKNGAELLGACASVLSDRGYLYFSTNFQGWQRDTFVFEKWMKTFESEHGLVQQPLGDEPYDWTRTGEVPLQKRLWRKSPRHRHL